MLPLLRFDSWLNVLGLLVLIAASAASGATVPGERASAWTSAVPPGLLRRRRWLAASGLLLGALLLLA